MKKSQKIFTLLNNDYQKYKAFLFDLDHTLFRVNTSFRFGLFLYNQNVLPLFKMIYLLICYGLHVLGWLSIRSLHFKTMRAFFQGKSMEELSHLANAFLDRYFMSLQNDKVICFLQEIQSQGKFIAILSSSPVFLVEAIANRLGIVHFLGTEYSVNAYGKIDGISMLVQGGEKAAYVKNLIHSGEYSEEDLVALSDSIHDLPFLNSVGVPIVVNPDRQLYQYSLQKEWTIFS